MASMQEESMQEEIMQEASMEDASMQEAIMRDILMRNNRTITQDDNMITQDDEMIIMVVEPIIEEDPPVQDIIMSGSESNCSSDCSSMEESSREYIIMCDSIHTIHTIHEEMVSSSRDLMMEDEDADIEIDEHAGIQDTVMEDLSAEDLEGRDSYMDDVGIDIDADAVLLEDLDSAMADADADANADAKLQAHLEDSVMEM